ATGARATLMLDGREHGELHVATPGEHMALNALAALLAAREVASDVPVPTEAFLGGLSGFGGVGRRFEAKGTLETGGGAARVFEDYAPHPTEVSAVRTAARELVPRGGGRPVRAVQ